MEKLKLSKTLKSLPKDYSKHATRDLSVFTASVFAETYEKTFRKYGLSFSSNCWLIDKDLCTFFRSQKEQDRFAQKTGARCKKNSRKYAKKLADELIELTDWIKIFIKDHPSQKSFLKDSSAFIATFRKFFAIHQIVYWSGDYLSKNTSAQYNGKLELLQASYKYNELIIPLLEKYFKKLKINNFLYDELKEITPQKNCQNRSVGILFVKKKRIILNEYESKFLFSHLDKNNISAKNKINEIKGISAHKGRKKGKINLIKNINHLSRAKEGEILVTIMTRPQFNNSLKKLGAIITDEGGILCHAAMLAREFKIPCVVGTKIATQILKDGDIVEVDADNGVVKII